MNNFLSRLCLCFAFIPLLAEAKRPNIVMVVLDDLDEQISPYLEAMKETKKLYQSGMVFKSHTIPTPWCCPSRASIFTGLYSHNNGMTNQVGPIFPFKDFTRPLDVKGNPMVDAQGNQINNEDRTFAKYLQDTGYRTALIGKYVNGPLPGYVSKGWNQFDIVLGNAYSGYDYELTESNDLDENCQKLKNRKTTVVAYGKDEKDYSTDVFANKAVKFLQCADKHNDDQPFFLYVTPTAPHAPIEAAPRHLALQAQWENLDKHTYLTKPNFKEADLSDKSAWLRNSAAYRDLTLDGQEEGFSGGVTVDFTRRMGSLYAADELIGRLVQTLQATGEWENTIFVFSSDNGFNLGAHHLSGKHVPFEESARVPMFIAGAGVRQGISDLPSSHIDLAPTFLDLAGLPVPSHMDGRSLVSHFQIGRTPQWQRKDLLFRVKSTAAFLYPYVSGGKDPLLSSGVVSSAQIQYALETNDILHGDAALFKSLALLWKNVTLRQVIDQMEQYDSVPGYRALKSGKYTYIEWFENHPYQAPTYELYDNSADPQQLNNLLATPGFSPVELYRLRQRLSALSNCSGPSCW